MELEVEEEEEEVEVDVEVDMVEAMVGEVELEEVEEVE